MSDLEYRQAQRRAEQQYQLNEGPGWDAVKRKAGDVWDAAKPAIQGVGDWAKGQAMDRLNKTDAMKKAGAVAGDPGDRIEQAIKQIEQRVGLPVGGVDTIGDGGSGPWHDRIEAIAQKLGAA